MIDILSDIETLAIKLNLDEKTIEILLDIVEAILFKEKFVVTKASAKYRMTDYMVRKDIKLLIELGLIKDLNNLK